MQIDWSTVVATLGSTAVVVAAIAWTSKALVDHFLSRDIEEFKAKLSREQELAVAAREAAINERTSIRLAEVDRLAKAQLAEQQHAFDLQSEAVKARQGTELARTERIRGEIERWANPILGAVQDLLWRLENILELEGYRVLLKSRTTRPSGDWAATRDYFLPTTVFLLGQYFCWVRQLEELLTFDLFAQVEDKDRFLRKLRAVADTLGRWPYPEVTEGSQGQDFQVFRLQHRALGEALFPTAGTGPGCMRLADFLGKWGDPNFRDAFQPLVALIDCVSPGTPRWNRLSAMLERLGELEAECRQILSLPERSA